MKVIPEEERSMATRVEFKDCRIRKSQKTLSVSWDPKLDILHFKFNVRDLKSCTEREVASLIAKVCDPLGLLIPFTVRSKRQVQQLWKEGYGWDDVLPVSIQTKW